MRETVAAGTLFLAVGCGPVPAPDDARGQDALSIDAAVLEDDAFDLQPDAVVGDQHICSGNAVPLDLECRAQNAATASPCGGHGYYVFDGACWRAEGEECTGETGAFDTLEDCAVACARAGLYTGVQVNAEGMFGCDFVRENFTCEFIGIQDAASIPDDCSLWGPFGRAARGGPRVRGDVADAWLMLTSASLAGPLGGGWCAAVLP